jgi:hypothetical protein
MFHGRAPDDTLRKEIGIQMCWAKDKVNIGLQLKVLHVPFGYFPDVCGGTEVYVAGLVRELGPLGMASIHTRAVR